MGKNVGGTGISTKGGRSFAGPLFEGPADGDEGALWPCPWLGTGRGLETGAAFWGLGLSSVDFSGLDDRSADSIPPRANKVAPPTNARLFADQPSFTGAEETTAEIPHLRRHLFLASRGHAG